MNHFKFCHYNLSYCREYKKLMFLLKTKSFWIIESWDKLATLSWRNEQHQRIAELKSVCKMKNVSFNPKIFVKSFQLKTAENVTYLYPLFRQLVLGHLCKDGILPYSHHSLRWKYTRLFVFDVLEWNIDKEEKIQFLFFFTMHGKTELFPFFFFYFSLSDTMFAHTKILYYKRKIRNVVWCFQQVKHLPLI